MQFHPAMMAEAT